MGLKYDLHIHTALSPCADNDMTPATVAGLCKLAGADVIAVTDHNSARNLPAAKAACDYYGLKLLPGIEVNTAEEIHVLCYFPSVAAALDMDRQLFEKLPDIAADPEIWGEQLVMDEDDNITDRVGKLLANAVGMDIYEIKARCDALGGVALPAHADRSSTSVFSVLGMFPVDIDFAACELRHPGLYGEYIEKGLMPNGLEILFSSDAHHLQALDRASYPELAADSVLMPLITGL